MRRTWTVRRGVLYALLLLVPLACGDDDGVPTDPGDPPGGTGGTGGTGGPGGTGGTSGPAALELPTDSLAFAALGDSAQLVAVVQDAAGVPIPGATITWTTTDTTVAAASATRRRIALPLPARTRTTR